MKCPQCHTENPPRATECDSCGVVFAHLKRNALPARSNLLCAWNEHGILCDAKGILSNCQNGAGPWYCREHWAKLNNEDAQGIIGNALPAHAKRPDESTLEFLKRVPWETRSRSPDMKQWDDWKYNSKAKRLERKVVPKIEIDDGLDAFVPEEASQA